MSDVQTQEELQENLRLVIRNWTLRQKYEALKYLYALLNVKIDDLPARIAREHKAEVAQGKPGSHE